MKVSIRKSKHQKESMTADQFRFASECVRRYMKDNICDKESYMIYDGSTFGDKIGCEIYQTKTTISCVVRFL